MKPILTLVMVVAVLLTSCAKVVVVDLSKAPVKADGVFYALPKTVVRVNLTVEKVEAKAARFTRFAAIFAPGAEPVCELNDNNECVDAKSYQVKPGAAFSTFGEPDPDHVYMVKFIGRGQLDQSVTMAWNESGLLTGAKASVTDRTSDIVVSGLGLLSGLGTRFAFGGGTSSADFAKITGSCSKYDPTRSDSANDPWIIEALKTQKNMGAADDLIANYCAIKPEDRGQKFNKQRDEDLLKEATKAYDSVVSLTTMRAGALGGSAPSEPLGLSQKLDALIADKVQALYVGRKNTTPWEGIFEVRDLGDSSSGPKSTLLLHLDKKKGFCLEVPVAPGVKPIAKEDQLANDDCRKAKAVQLNLSFYPDRARQLFGVVGSRTSEPDGERSFRYRIPAQVKAELDDGMAPESTVYGTAIMSVAQLGLIASLPAKRNSKMLSYDLTFVESTGALKGFTLGTTGAIDSALIDKLSGIGNSIVDARNKSRADAQAQQDKDAAAQDELNVLTRRAEILKLRDQICDLLKKYGQPCEFAP